jgi:hypothetical protein
MNGFHDHHHRRCGNSGCLNILEEELFAEEAVLAVEGFECGGCGGGYIEPRVRPGYDTWLGAQGAMDVAVGEMTGDPFLVAEGVVDELEADFGL